MHDGTPSPGSGPKAAAHPSPAGDILPGAEPSASAPSSRLADFAELTKARLASLVLMTTATGYLAAQRGPVPWSRFAVTLAGTALAALGAMALNQWQERDLDAQMRRTRNRPLPGGRISPAAVFATGLVLAASGVAILFALINVLTGTLALAVVAVYTLVYTPLKTRTTLCTLVGAVCGALPPIMGWTAATGRIAPGAVLLGALLFVWQIPHFLALAWLYRDDYARGGFRMLPSVDPDGAITARMAVIYTLALVPLGVLAIPARLGGPVAALAATALAAALVALAMQLLRDRSDRSARRVFFATLIYLPLLLALIVADPARPITPGGRVADLAGSATVVR